MSRAQVTTRGRMPSDQHFDVIVIGAGIYGAAHTWEAASRGLSVVLLEQSDFGSATSANSLKTIHGGIRYLQDLNVTRVLESKRERDTYIRIAPHLVQPLACAMPSYAWTMKGRVATALGAGLYNLLSAYDDLVSPHPTRRLRAGLLSKHRIHRYLSNAQMGRINGGIHWQDGQVYDSERLVLDFILSAAHQGAHVFNYMQAKRLIVVDNAVRGVVVEDRLDGVEYTLHGQWVIDTTGPWFDQNHRAWGLPGAGSQALAKAVNLVFACKGPVSAFGMKLKAATDKTEQSDRLLFVAPWRERTIIGTWYFPLTDQQSAHSVTPDEYEICMADARQLRDLSADECEKPSLIHIGLVPVEREFVIGEYPSLAEDTIVANQDRLGGPTGFISVCGVKYTTARVAAEKTINVVAEQLGDYPPSTTSSQPLYGGYMDDYDEFCCAKLERYGALIDASVLKNLLRSYGSSIDRLMDCAARDASLYDVIPGTADCIKAQIVYAVRAEWAQRLIDVVVRRIGVGGLGRPDDATITCCADVMAAELTWTPAERAEHIRELEQYYGSRC